MHKNYLEISQVGIEFPTEAEPFRALQNVNLSIQQGEFISLINKSEPNRGRSRDIFFCPMRWVLGEGSGVGVGTLEPEHDFIMK